MHYLRWTEQDAPMQPGMAEIWTEADDHGRDVLKRELEDAGWTLKPGSGRGPHDVYEKPGAPQIQLPRHREIKPGTAKGIREILRRFR